MKQDTQKAGWKKWSLPVRIGIAAGACWLVARELNWEELKSAFLDLNLWVLALAAIIYTAEQGFLGFRWWLLLRAQRIAVPLRLAVKLNYLGLFFSSFLPSSVGGDLVRAWHVSRHSSRKLQAAFGVFVDRVVGLFATLIIAFAAILLFMRDTPFFRIQLVQQQLQRLRHISGPHVLLVLLIILGAGLVLHRPLEALTGRMYRYLKHLLGQLHQVLAVYYRHPFVLVTTIMLTIVLQSLVILVYWLVGMNLNIDATVGYYFVFFPVVWVVGSIPISIAGIGILEGGIVFLFVRYTGATTEAAAALALCQRLTWLAASLPGLVFHLTGSHRRAQTNTTPA